jgi:methionyl-tRNA formyltransferase
MALMRLVYFGSGAFGLPTLEHMAAHHDIALVVTQPDRPAGRKRRLTPTPIAQRAADHHLPIVKPEKVNDASVIEQVRAIDADAWVVIAFGQKLGRRLLADRFAINLHASLLPKFRGAAPINWAIIAGERETGVSVIALADRMDAGEVYSAVATTILPHETAGELHDRLALFGPDAIEDVLQRRAGGSLIGQPQDERLASSAPKLAKADGAVDFNQPATAVRNRIHGLTPWPGCIVRLDGHELRLHRAQVVNVPMPPGGDLMPFAAYRNGHFIHIGARVEPAR